MCFIKANAIAQSAGLNASPIIDHDQTSVEVGKASAEGKTTVDAKLRKLYDELDSLGEGVLDLGERWELYIVCRALDGCVRAIGGSCKSSEAFSAETTETTMASPSPSENEKWYSDLQLFLSQLGRLSLSYATDAEALLLDDGPDDEPLSEAERASLLADVPRLEEWCEGRRECLKATIEIYKETAARYISNRPRLGFGHEQGKGGGQTTYSSIGITGATDGQLFDRALMASRPVLPPATGMAR